MRKTSTSRRVGMLGGQKRVETKMKANCSHASGLTRHVHRRRGSFYISSLQCISWIPYRDFIVVPLTLNSLIDPIYVSNIVSVSMLPLQGGRIRMQERVHIVRLFRWNCSFFKIHWRLQFDIFSLSSAPFLGGDPTALGDLDLEDSGDGFTSCILKLFSCSKSKSHCLLRLKTCEQLLPEDGQDLASSPSSSRSSSSSSSIANRSDESGDSKTPSLAEGAGKVPESEL